jgi:type II secretory ATPase GspE/PulE/Tfp pilus assembly ATPase PilB-like protein
VASVRNSGFSGRIGIFELLVPSDRLLDAVASGAGLQQLRELGSEEGYTALRIDGMEKVKAG